MTTEIEQVEGEELVDRTPEMESHLEILTSQQNRIQQAAKKRLEAIAALPADVRAPLEFLIRELTDTVMPTLMDSSRLVLEQFQYIDAVIEDDGDEDADDDTMRLSAGEVELLAVMMTEFTGLMQTAQMPATVAHVREQLQGQPKQLAEYEEFQATMAMRIKQAHAMYARFTQWQQQQLPTATP